MLLPVQKSSEFLLKNGEDAAIFVSYINTLFVSGLNFSFITNCFVLIDAEDYRQIHLIVLF